MLHDDAAQREWPQAQLLPALIGAHRRRRGQRGRRHSAGRIWQHAGSSLGHDRRDDDVQPCDAPVWMPHPRPHPRRLHCRMRCCLTMMSLPHRRLLHVQPLLGRHAAHVARRRRISPTTPRICAGCAAFPVGRSPLALREARTHPPAASAAKAKQARPNLRPSMAWSCLLLSLSVHLLSCFTPA